MNCANHSDIAAVAFCRTCGKPLCQTCTRDVRGVIYCESCLAARLDGTRTSRRICTAGPNGLSAGRTGVRSAGSSVLRTQSDCSGNSCRIFSDWCGRCLCRPVRQRFIAPRDHGAADSRPRLRSPVVCDHDARDHNRIFLRVPDHRCGSNRESGSDGRACARPVRAGGRRSVLERNLKEPKFLPVRRS